jgi:hypothetical protein
LRSAQKNRKAARESHERLMVVGSQGAFDDQGHIGADCRRKLAYRRRDPWFLFAVVGISTMVKVSANDQGKPSPFGAMALARTWRPIAPAAGAVTRCTQLIEPPRISQ